MNDVEDNVNEHEKTKLAKPQEKLSEFEKFRRLTKELLEVEPGKTIIHAEENEYENEK